MNAVEKYLSRLPPTDPRDLDGVVVIPSFRESANISHTLQSVAESFGPRFHAIVVVNAPDERTARESNEETVRACLDFEHVTVVDRFSEHFLDGVGAARRVGMDLAASWLRDDPTKFIVSLDADTVISGDYAAALGAAESETVLALARFEHPLNNDAIVDYEVWLRLFALGLRWANSPFAWTALGSRFAVRMHAYCAVAGIAQRQAGEDFHFMNKVSKTFGAERVQMVDVCVHPSDRASDRVPFGTGPAVISNDEKYRTLEPVSAFEEVRTLHDSIRTSQTMENVAPLLRSWIENQSDFDSIAKIANDSPDRKRFQLRFYQWWDGLREIRYIRERERELGRSEISDAVRRFTTCEVIENRRDLLLELRKV